MHVRTYTDCHLAGISLYNIHHHNDVYSQLPRHYLHLYYQLQYCDNVTFPFSLIFLFVEGDILDCIIEFPRYALLHV
jgi:hypothetical protein